MSETAQAYSWIVASCLADTALMAVASGVFQGFAPVGTTTPYVLIVQQNMVDTVTFNGRRLMSRGLFQIKAVGATSAYASLVTMADRIDALFKSQSSVALSPSGGILEAYRQQSLSYDEINAGVQWSHLGGLYHIDVQAN